MTFDSNTVLLCFLAEYMSSVPCQRTCVRPSVMKIRKYDEQVEDKYLSTNILNFVYNHFKKGSPEEYIGKYCFIFRQWFLQVLVCSSVMALPGSARLILQYMSDGPLHTLHTSTQGFKQLMLGGVPR